MGRTPDHWKTSSPRPNGLMARPGTESSNPSPSSGESGANLIFGGESHRWLSGIAAECVFVDERGAVGIRLKPAAAIVRLYGNQFQAPRRTRQPLPPKSLPLL